MNPLQHIARSSAWVAVIAILVIYGSGQQTAALFDAAGVPGMGGYAALFLALVTALEQVRYHLANQLQLVESALVAAVRSANSRTDLDQAAIHRFFVGELADSVLGGELPDTPAGIDAYLQGHPGLLSKLLETAISRVNAQVNQFGGVGAGLAGTLGLLGTVDALITVLGRIGVGTKKAMLSGSELLSAMGLSDLASAFSTTKVGCLVTLAVTLIFATGLFWRVTALKADLQRAVAILQTRVVTGTGVTGTGAVS